MAKAKKRQAMGRGLSALLPTDENLVQGSVEGKVIELPLNQIETNPFQPRTQFNPDTFVRVANDQESLEMALVENIQRDDLDPIEIALSYERLINEIKLTQEQMSKRVGKKRSTVTNYLRLLHLDPIIQSGIRDGFISMGHGRALLSVADKQEQLKLYKKIVANGMSVRATEQAVKPKKAKTPSTQNYTAKHLDAFKTFFNAPVQTTVDKNGAGKIIISFASEEEFENIRKKLN
jgi:ParB family chromosome partitioning protein